VCNANRWRTHSLGPTVFASYLYAGLLSTCTEPPLRRTCKISLLAVVIFFSRQKKYSAVKNICHNLTNSL
jgi:hypothetical protein